MAINDMLRESQYNLSYYTIVKYSLQEAMEFDDYSEQTRRLKEKYKQRLLNKFDDPFTSSIIKSPYFYRSMAKACVIGVETGLKINLIL